MPYTVGPPHMKILHVCESIIGGTGSYLAELIPHQVSLYGRRNVQLLIPSSQLQFLDPAIVAAEPTILTFERPSRLLGMWFLGKAHLKALRAFRPQVVHAHSSIAGIVVRLLGLRRRYRIVYCPHGWSIDRQGTGSMLRIAVLMERWLGALCEGIIVISPHEYDRAIELGFPPEKVALVNSGVRRECPDVAPAEWQDERIRVLYAGRFDRQKGVDVLLEAIEPLGDRLCLRLVGGFVVNGGSLSEPLPPHVADLGWMDREGVYAQMKACDVLVVPSRWEGFGLVAVEAMRMQVPVIAAAVGGLVAILGRGQYGLMVPPDDVAALRDCLANLTKEQLRELGRIGHERFLSAYTSDRMVREIDEVYASVLYEPVKEPVTI